MEGRLVHVMGLFAASTYTHSNQRNVDVFEALAIQDFHVAQRRMNSQMPTDTQTGDTVKKVRRAPAKKAPAKTAAKAPAKTASVAKRAPAKQAKPASEPKPKPAPAAESRPERKESTPATSGSSDSHSRDRNAKPAFDLRNRQQHQQQGGGMRHSDGGGDMAGGSGRGRGRNKNKNKNKKRRPSGGGMGGYGGGSSVPMHALPNDEDVAREAAELEKMASTDAYKEASEKALHVSELQKMPLAELHELAEAEGVEDVDKLPRTELIFDLLRARADKDELMFGEGTLQIMPERFGFLRLPEASYLSGPCDVYVTPSQIRRYGLRPGMEIQGAIRPPRDNERFFALLRVDKVNGKPLDSLRHLPIFEDLTPLHPEERYVLETTQDVIETRVIDLVAPIGRGQRGLIVAPPRTGKTVILQKITRAISLNYPDVKIIVLLIDERPEEVTDFRRNTTEFVEVVASTFDEVASRHVQVAEMVMEKARRYVEFGQHCVILLDSITRLARAYNAAQPNSGKIMSGGIDSNALTRPKKFFGSARAIEGGGSLTILGTALVDTGSKADEVIFEEFKGTGNSELHLDRKLVEKRIWPAIDVSASGTRREELLLDPKELELTYRLRKVLSDMNVVEAMELLKTRLTKSKSNAEFLMTMNLN